VRVGVGPAPVLGALEADRRELLVDPELALAGDREPQRVGIVRVAALLAERAGRALAEDRDVDAVVGARLDLVDRPLAVGELGGGVEVVIAELAAAAAPAGAGAAAVARPGRDLAREVADDRLVLPD